MPVIKWIMLAGAAVGAGLVGFFLLPILWAAVTGLIAGLLTAVGFGVPGILELVFGLRIAPALAIVGFVGGAYWVVTSR